MNLKADIMVPFYRDMIVIGALFGGLNLKILKTITYILHKNYLFGAVFSIMEHSDGSVKNKQ
ncbi:MAG TPA: hypothetical protein VK663_09085 [Burkholderiales bacterium]|nr:hypothetical protein [Burkholderiales bacterium]